MKSILYLTCILAFGLVVEAAQAGKEFSSQESASLENSANYSIQKKTKTDSFQGKTSEIVSNEELIQKTTKKLVAQLREEVLNRVLARCMEEFGDCRESETKVVKVDDGGVRAQAVQSNSGLKMDIEKKVKVSATVQASAIGYTPKKKGDNAGEVHEVTVEKIVYKAKEAEKKLQQVDEAKVIRLMESKERKIEKQIQKSPERRSKESPGKKARVLPTEVKKP